MHTRKLKQLFQILNCTHVYCCAGVYKYQNSFHDEWTTELELFSIMHSGVDKWGFKCVLNGILDECFLLC